MVLLVKKYLRFGLELKISEQTVNLKFKLRNFGCSGDNAVVVPKRKLAFETFVVKIWAQFFWWTSKYCVMFIPAEAGLFGYVNWNLFDTKLTVPLRVKSELNWYIITACAESTQFGLLTIVD